MNCGLHWREKMKIEYKENEEQHLLDIPSISIQSSAQLEPISDSSPVSATFMDMESDAEHSEY